jgi:hypothetical protein
MKDIILKSVLFVPFIIIMTVYMTWTVSKYYVKTCIEDSKR